MKATAFLAVVLGAIACHAPEPVAPSEPAGQLVEPELEDAPLQVFGSVDFTPEELDLILTLSPLPPIPDDPTNAFDTDPRAALLGQALFYDPRYSKDGDISCSFCHQPDKGWSDGLDIARANGILPRHSMTLWNVAYQRWFFWDGRADTLWSQALQPLEEPREHATNRLAVLHTLKADAAQSAAFEELFGALPDLEQEGRFPAAARPIPDDPEHPENVAWESMQEEDRERVNRAFANFGKALAAFERLIVSRRAPFDVFVEGLLEGDPHKQRAITASAQRGLKLFLGRGRCHLCHSGPLFSDLEFHNNRLPPLEGGTSMDPGRFHGINLVQADPFNGVGSYSDEVEGEPRMKVAYLLRSSHNYQEFKTASLRNVAVTAPYMHQGQFGTLREVLHFYNTLEGAVPLHHAGEQLLLPLGLNEEELRDLEAFLESLTDTRIDPALESPPVSLSDPGAAPGVGSRPAETGSERTTDGTQRPGR